MSDSRRFLQRLIINVEFAIDLNATLRESSRFTNLLFKRIENLLSAQNDKKAF